MGKCLYSSIRAISNWSYINVGYILIFLFILSSHLLLIMGIMLS